MNAGQSRSAAASGSLVLVSHTLCPYVQRVAIVLREKGLGFERRDVDLARKPTWFLELSPLGRTPVLQVEGQALFESAVICEYLDEAYGPRLHPAGPLERARERAWVEFASAVLQAIATWYNAPHEATLQAAEATLRGRCEHLETALKAGSSAGPWFAGSRFGLVDAAFAPAFRYFDVLEQAGVDGVQRAWPALPRISAWRRQLAQRASVREAVAPDYGDRLLGFLAQRPSALGHRVAQAAPASP